MHTILLVEDDAAAVALMHAIVEPHVDWRLVVANSGDDAIELAVREQPEVILLDIVLPTMSGIETCKRLKGNAATTAACVIFLTGIAKPSTEAEARAAGADEYLRKPYSTAKLVETIEAKLAAA